jgi:hypothetical protein
MVPEKGRSVSLDSGEYAAPAPEPEPKGIDTGAARDGATFGTAGELTAAAAA